MYGKKVFFLLRRFLIFKNRDGGIGIILGLGRT